MRWLIFKLLRDLRLALCILCTLLVLFQLLWVKITARLTGDLVPFFSQRLPLQQIEAIVFQGPGKIIQALMGGESIKLQNAMDILSIGYVHPFVQISLCIWAVGRGAGAIAGELEKGTMELLLAQPIPRWQLIAAHLCVDLLTIPLLVLSLWAGTWLGVAIFTPIEPSQMELPVPDELGPIAKQLMQASMAKNKLSEAEQAELLRVHPWAMAKGLPNLALFVFALSGISLWLSSRGRSRAKVLSSAVLMTLVMLLVNLLGQLWDGLGWLRPVTLFFYYQPQPVILHNRWTVELGTAWNAGQPLLALPTLAVLGTVGTLGYGLAWWTFTRRDLPAPL